MSSILGDIQQAFWETWTSILTFSFYGQENVHRRCYLDQRTYLILEYFRRENFRQIWNSDENFRRRTFSWTKTSPIFPKIIPNYSKLCYFIVLFYSKYYDRALKWQYDLKWQFKVTIRVLIDYFKDVFRW